MKPLSNTQRRILTAASKDPYTIVETHMESIKSPAVRRQVIYSMLCSGYVIEDDGGHLITGEGIEALGGKKAKEKPAKAEKKEKQKKQPAKEPEATAAAKSDQPAKGRQLLIDMMSRDEGATGQQMVEATGWQKGAVFGTLSKIRKLLESNGQIVASEKDGSGKLVYKVVGNAA